MAKALGLAHGRLPPGVISEQRYGISLSTTRCDPTPHNCVAIKPRTHWYRDIYFDGII